MGIVVLVMLNKILIIVLLSTFTLEWAGIPKTKSIDLCPFLTLSVRDGLSVNFGTIISPVFMSSISNT